MQMQMQIFARAHYHTVHIVYSVTVSRFSKRDAKHLLVKFIPNTWCSFLQRLFPLYAAPTRDTLVSVISLPSSSFRSKNYMLMLRKSKETKKYCVNSAIFTWSGMLTKMAFLYNDWPRPCRRVENVSFRYDVRWRDHESREWNAKTSGREHPKKIKL